MKSLLSTLLLLALAGASLHAEEAKKIQGAKIIFLGDSLTSNNGSLGPARGYYHWTDVVKERFKLDFVNLGKGGSRADAGLERLIKALVEEKQKPDFVLINFGMNDHKIASKTRAAVSSVEAFSQQLTDIIKLVRSENAVPILVVPHAIFEGTKEDPRAYYNKYDPEMFVQEGGALKRFDKFMDAIRAVAAKEKVGLIDIRKESDKYEGGKMTLEGVHLNDVGHKVYGDMIGNYLAEKY